MAWYNTYRPTQFDQVLGQDLVKQILENAIQKKQVRHAYLLSGPRGVGKTTLARIFAHALNGDTANTSDLDIIELDAASNTGIDDIRLLRESASVPPISGAYKIFIIDEVHMLSKSAMNALLKILEEPPSYLVFLLATTNPEKILSTVLSRLTKLPLKAHTKENLIKQMQIIADQEGLKVDRESLSMIAERSSGAQRDAINTLETLAGYGFEELTPSVVASLLGVVPQESLKQLNKILTSGAGIQEYITVLDELSLEPNQFLDQALNYYLDESLSFPDLYTPVIKSLATVGSLRLPLVSNSQVIGLVFTYLDKNTHKIQDVMPEKKTELKPEPEIVQVIQGTTKTEPAVPLTETIDVSQILLREDKPNSLKMIPDLSLELEGSTIKLKTSVGMFLPTLKSKVIEDWVKLSIQELLSQDVSIEIIQTTKLEPTTPIQTKSKPTKVQTNTSIENTKDEVFYSVYGAVPSEGKTEGLVALTQDILDPSDSKKQDKSFDEHADELFDFE